MDPRLSTLIGRYQRKVAEAVDMLEGAGIPRPASNAAWNACDVPGRGALPAGFAYYKHGFGCAVDGPAWSVDFDFGDQGQIDGFDAWRLYDFAHTRLLDYGFQSADEIERAMKAALDAGELRFSGYVLYYLTESGRRALPPTEG
jgi:hypothetical protein